MSYQLIIGKHEKDWQDNTVKFMGHTESTRLEIPSVEVAHEIAKLVGLTSYMIADSQDLFGYNALFVSPDITAWENNVKAERQADNEHQQKITDLINSKPLVYYYPELNFGNYGIVFKRSEARFNPAHSRQIQWSINAYAIEHDKPEHQIDINPGYYKSEDGKRLHKRFIDHLDYRLSHDTIALDNLWKLLPKIESIEKQLRQEIPFDN